MSSDCVRRCPVIYGRLWTIRGRVRGHIDALLGAGLLPGDALGMAPEQDGDAVPGPLRDLGGRHASIEPRRHVPSPDRLGVCFVRSGAADRPSAVDRDARNTGSPNDAEFHAFAEALGVDLEQVRGALDAYRQLHLLDRVRWAIDQRQERLDDLISALWAESSHDWTVVHTKMRDAKSDPASGLRFPIEHPTMSHGRGTLCGYPRQSRRRGLTPH